MDFGSFGCLRSFGFFAFGVFGGILVRSGFSGVVMFGLT